MMKLRPGLAIEMTCWTLSAVLFVVFFAARASGELGRQDAIAAFKAAAHAETAETASTPSLPQGRRPAGIRAEPAVMTYPAEIPPASALSMAREQGGLSETPTTGDVAGEELPVALLSINRVALEVPVFQDISERNLNRGAGLIDGTGLPGSEGNIAIAAHRDGYFRALKDVTKGDVLELETLHGSRQYRVSVISIVEPTDLWPLGDTDEAAVTLVTCYPFYFVGSAPQRYIVRAVAVK
jgi:LPXTG-site transpeptidase (sortase) family protein